jgi:hypothetical protein
MKVMEIHLEQLRADAAECRLMSDLATDLQKRELFAALAEHLSVLASGRARDRSSSNWQGIISRGGGDDARPEH